MINKKIASEIAIGLILILALVVGGIFWLQGKESFSMQYQPVQAVSQLQKNKEGKEGNIGPQSTWKTYANDEYGFKFDYPSEKLVMPEKPSEKLKNQIQYFIYSTEDKYHSSFDLTALHFYVNTDKKITFDESAKSVVSDSGVKWNCSEGVTFNGSGDNLFKDCWAIGKMYAFGMTAYFNKDVNYFTQEDFDKIRNSFKEL